jgi:hypothetical protein
MSDQVKIVTETTCLYVIVGDILKSICHSEDIRAQCSDSEIITTALIAGLHYGSNHSDANGFVQVIKLMPKMVESIGGPKRPIQSAVA